LDRLATLSSNPIYQDRHLDEISGSGCLKCIYLEKILIVYVRGFQKLLDQYLLVSAVFKSSEIPLETSRMY